MADRSFRWSRRRRPYPGRPRAQTTTRQWTVQDFEVDDILPADDIATAYRYDYGVSAVEDAGFITLKDSIKETTPPTSSRQSDYLNQTTEATLYDQRNLLPDYYNEGNATDFWRNASHCSSSIIQASHAAYLYGIIFMIVVSLLLNSLSVIIFRSKGLRKYPFSLYLVVIAVVDTLSLVSYIPRKWMTVFYMALGFEERKTVYDTNNIACKSLTYLTYVLRFLASWMLVALGTDRLLVASTPYKRSKYPNLRSAQHGLCYCVVAAILFNAHVLFVWDSTILDGDVTASCVPMSMSPILALGLTILTVVLIVGLPFIVIGALAIMIIRNLPAWKLRPRRLSSTVISRALFEKDATFMVVAILVSYCIFCIPYIITWVVLLWQHFMDELPLCRYIDGAAARDIAEVGFMVIFATKFLLCIFFGGDVLNQK